MFLRRRFLPVLAAAVFVLLAGCGNEAKKPVELKTIEDRFPIKVGQRVVQMQLAILLAESQKGLMYRKTMGADEGMLFLYDVPTQMSFWMRNTELPLDIGFFDSAGELKEIYPLYPHDERSVASRAGNLRFALEMNQGWFRKSGVKPGDKLDLKALTEAVRARGFQPENFGLR
jgi:uncharacterized membrane protein (UPF0127 family)